MVSSVKDQGSAGTCWAFSTVANLEGQFAMKGHKLMNLSVEQVVDCDDSKDVPKEFGDWGCMAGGHIWHLDTFKDRVVLNLNLITLIVRASQRMPARSVLMDRGTQLYAAHQCLIAT